MTDTTHSSLLKQDARTAWRNRAEARFKAYGLIAIDIGALMLLLLLSTIIGRGTGAFQQSYLTPDVTLDAAKLDKKGQRHIEDIKKDMSDILSKRAESQMRDAVLADPDLIGQTARFDFLASGRVDGDLKRRWIRDSIANDKHISAEQLDLVDQMRAAGALEEKFNIAFITGAESSGARPEAAGFGICMVCSVAMVLAPPIGVAASICLKEFAPKNRITEVRPCSRTLGYFTPVHERNITWDNNAELTRMISRLQRLIGFMSAPGAASSSCWFF